MLSFRLEHCFDGFAMFSVEHGFLDIYLTMFFGAGISGNTSAMRVILFRELFKI